MDKADGNQAEIVRALVAVGCSVTWIRGVHSPGAPDLLVGHAGRTYLMEVKAKKGRRLPSQKHWWANWRGGPLVEVRTIEEALAAIGLTVDARLGSA